MEFKQVENALEQEQDAEYVREVHRIFPTKIMTVMMKPQEVFDQIINVEHVQTSEAKKISCSVGSNILDQYPELKKAVQENIDAFASSVGYWDGKFDLSSSWHVKVQPGGELPETQFTSNFIGGMLFTNTVAGDYVLFTKGAKPVDSTWTFLPSLQRVEAAFEPYVAKLSVKTNMMVLFPGYLMHSTAQDGIICQDRGAIFFTANLAR